MTVHIPTYILLSSLLLGFQTYGTIIFNLLFGKKITFTPSTSCNSKAASWQVCYHFQNGIIQTVHHLSFLYLFTIVIVIDRFYCSFEILLPSLHSLKKILHTAINMNGKQRWGGYPQNVVKNHNCLSNSDKT